jgi:diguanylate cyclase (GGDEF)-like protein
LTREPLSYSDDLAALRLRSLPGIAFSRYLDADRSVYFLSESCLALTEFSASELITLSKDNLAFNDLIDPEDWADLLGRVAVAVQMNQPYAVEYRIKTRSGEVRWFLEQGYVSADGSLEGLMTDVSALKLTQGKLRLDAFYDKLTGLPNRSLFLDRLAQAVRRLQRDLDYQFAVLFLDLDRFKVINDSLGHRAGDLLLVQVAQRLSACVRPGDTVARLGGDEFTMLIDAVHGLEDVVQIAERILTDMATAFQVDEHEIFSTTSIGIALSLTSYENAEDLIRDADIALYQAKAMGKACYALFQPGMHIHAVARLELENDLRRAIANQEFCLLYQPIVRLESSALEGFEAFVYWVHPTRGLLAPGEFLPVAQEAGLMMTIGQWVLATACAQLALWHRRFPMARSVFMSVNLSSAELAHPDLIGVLRTVLERAGLDPRFLRIEMTQELLVQGAESVRAQLHAVRAMGVQLYIDDFGTGFSSLSYLDSLPVDGLKMDLSFVARIESSEVLEIVRTILTLAHGLALYAVAEGVESLAQLAQLRAMGCVFGQGFLFARPMEALQAFHFLERQFEGDDFTALSMALPRLLIHSTVGLYQLLLLGGSSWSVGRAPDCSIFLPDRMVSRAHAMILQMPRSDQFFWVDLGSRNGSFINFQPVRLPTLLQDGDLIRVGNRLEMQFVAAPDLSQVLHDELTVMMHQPTLLHGQLWREVLMALHVSVIWLPSDVSMLNSLRQMETAGERLPRLLLVDLMTLDDDDFLAFFEALALVIPTIPVVLTMPQVSDDFSALQVRARAAGAVDLIPLFRLVGSDFGVYRDALAQKVITVFDAMGMTLEHEDALTAATTALRIVLRNETLF